LCDLNYDVIYNIVSRCDAGKTGLSVFDKIVIENLKTEKIKICLHEFIIQNI